jgi:hypothetical protein
MTLKVKVMRVYLEPWVVQDGQIPELRAGEVMREVGIAAACWTGDRSEGFDLCEEVPGEDPDGIATAHAVLDGVLTWRGADRVGVLRVGDVQFVVKGVVEQVAVETFERRPLELPAVGERMRVHAALYVMPAHEADLDWNDGAASPDVQRDWLVQSVVFERRGRGNVVSVETLDRMQAWEDEGSGGEYQLDLSPA